MPFTSIEEVKKRVDGVDDLSDAQLQVYMDTFNGCVDDHGGEEKGEDFNCFAIAKSKAKGDI